MDGPHRFDLRSKLDYILKTSGFILLTGHNVPEKIISDQWSAVSKFFQQSDENKQSVATPYPGYPYGWIGLNKALTNLLSGHTIDFYLMLEIQLIPNFTS